MAFDRPIGVITVCCEASSASQFERECVARSFFNRLRDGRFGRTIAAICLERFQYSEWNGDAADNANLERVAAMPDGDMTLQQCGEAYDTASDGGDDPTKGATHYHDKTIAPPGWTVGATMTLETPKFFFYANVR